MERVKWACVDSVTHYDLNGIEDKMSLEELKEMKRKMVEVIGTMFFRDATERIIAENAFKKGYLASHTFYETLR